MHRNRRNSNRINWRILLNDQQSSAGITQQASHRRASHRRATTSQVPRIVSRRKQLLFLQLVNQSSSETHYFACTERGEQVLSKSPLFKSPNVVAFPRPCSLDSGDILLRFAARTQSHWLNLAYSASVCLSSLTLLRSNRAPRRGPSAVTTNRARPCGSSRFPAGRV